MKITETSKTLMIRIFIFSIIILVLAAVVLRNPSSILFFGLGILIGSLVSCIRVYMLERTLNKSLDLASADANLFARSQFLVRYVLTGVVLVFAALISSFSLYGAAFGLVSLQLAAYSQQLKQKK